MAIPRTRNIIREDIPGSPDWIEALLTLLNRGFNDVKQVLDHGLTASENQLAEVKTITVKMPVEFPAWRYPGSTGEPAYQNSFTGWFGTKPGDPAFRMWPNGMVELMGTGKTGGTAPASYVTIFPLPPGFAPPATLRLGVPTGGGMKMLEVTPAGAVTTGNATPAWTASDWFSLDCITWQAKGVAAKADLFAKPFPIQVATSGRFPIKHVQAMQWRDKTDKSRGVLGPGQLVWESDGTGLRITAIWGLQPGRTYDIDLLLSAG